MRLGTGEDEARKKGTVADPTVNSAYTFPNSFWKTGTPGWGNQRI